VTAVDARAPVDESAVQAAERCISADRLRELVQRIVDVPSPTGEEAPLAAVLAAELRTAGSTRACSPSTTRRPTPSAACAGPAAAPTSCCTRRSTRSPPDGPRTTCRGPAPELRPDLLPTARVTGDLVVGLGAGNPKGHVACVLAAAEAVAAAGLPLQGDLLAAFGAGGMPTNALPGPRRATGQGAGCSFLLEQGGWADMAVIAKPGWAVSHEEVGLAWLELRVHGSPTYVGSRHRLPYDNAVAGAAALVLRLERWFEQYAVAHTDGLVSPQGVVGAVEGGWTRMPAVTPAVCRVLVDLRLSPARAPCRPGAS
jgi:acetylornithine deacetylase/succinyl-diaminopimelate desuccinylase-like protein